MTIRTATTTDATAWDTFLATQPYRPFLQSWTMGEVYRDIGQEPIRLVAEEHGGVVGICQGVTVAARRGKHLALLYGPIASSMQVRAALLAAMRTAAQERDCAFVRVSPFLPQSEHAAWQRALSDVGIRTWQSPLHLLAEHLWLLPLHETTDASLLAGMRKTTRNLIRRAERDGVTIHASKHPIADTETFIRLHDETRKRHKFTPYTNAFFRAQVAHFAPRNECTVYLAQYQGETIAASIHMHAFGETSYHHGASSAMHAKIPASYLLQWTAICDALKRNDRLYNFWGIAPMHTLEDGTRAIAQKNHPFAGVTLFKTGFGGKMVNLLPCTDLPLRNTYLLTRTFERVRKWKRGF